VAAERLPDINVDSERAFLVGTALRVAFSWGRKTVRWQLDEDMDRRVGAARDVLDEQTAIQLCDLALSKVDPELVEIFVLFELEDLTSPEIAALLEIPLGTVASRLRRAREQFRLVVSRIELTMRREGNA
jgi:RNA polymerase sigma-70 factor (ECF subfamily)